MTRYLTKGYWKVPFDPDARLKPAFVTPLGQYKSLVLPFSLKEAPVTYQHQVDQLLGGMETFTLVYIDDICAISQTWEDHVSQVKWGLSYLQDSGLTVKAGKCKVGMAEVSYLGHKVGSGCLKPEPPKVGAIRDWPAPQTTTQTQGFIGMAGHYQRLVPHFSSVSAPKKGKPDKLVWSEQCQRALCTLKEDLFKGPVLGNPDFDKSFMVFTDAPDTGLGTVPRQAHAKGEKHHIMNLSRKLLPWEQGYAAIEKECLAMEWALTRLQPDLFGQRFTVCTDYSPCHGCIR
ncbi:unnamed protein product [Lepidochelys kempii]